MGKQGKAKAAGFSRRRSSVWMNCTDMGNGRAQCNICWKDLAYRNGSTYNLKRHMQTKHSPDEMLNTAPIKRLPTVSDDETAVASASIGMMRPKKSVIAKRPLRLKGKLPTSGRQTTIVATAGENIDLGSVINGEFDISNVQVIQTAPVAIMGTSKQRVLDEALLEMIATDFHPLSIVEDNGFRRFVGKLQPLYKIPTRQALFDAQLQQQYARTVNERRTELQQIVAVCLSAEGWLSSVSEHYIAITAHYLTAQLELKSCLLDCFSYTDQHTMVNVKDELSRIAEEWGLLGKVVAVVTDASPNLAAAVTLVGWRNLPCFAHMLNSMTQEVLAEVAELRVKVRSAIGHFQCNSIALEMLKNVLVQMSLPDRDLIQDSPISRWTTTYRMFQRMAEMREPILSSLALLVESVSDIFFSDNDWDILTQVCELLRPMYEVTCELAVERYSPASKIILMARGLTRLCREQLNNASLSPAVRNLAGILMNSMAKWFASLEVNNALAEATLLDPRFKRSGFVDDGAAEQAILNVTTAAGRSVPGQQTEDSIAYVVTESDGNVTAQNVSLPTALRPPSSSSIWSDYDQRVYIIVSSQSPDAEAQAQMRQFLEEPLVPRQESCLEWWQSRAAIYPRLVDVVRERLCIVATSAPCDRMYSKTGSILMDRRSRLDQSEVRQLVFLNANLNVS